MSMFIASSLQNVEAHGKGVAISAKKSKEQRLNQRLENSKNSRGGQQPEPFIDNSLVDENADGQVNPEQPTTPVASTKAKKFNTKKTTKKTISNDDALDIQGGEAEDEYTVQGYTIGVRKDGNMDIIAYVKRGNTQLKSVSSQLYKQLYNLANEEVKGILKENHE